MPVFEFHCYQEQTHKRFYVAAPDMGDAMIEFRSQDQDFQWTVKEIHEVIGTTVLETEYSLH